eukprot:sb/3474413/
MAKLWGGGRGRGWNFKVRVDRIRIGQVGCRYVVKISVLSILHFCRSKSTHPSLRHVCYVGRIPAGSILIKQDRNYPCVLLTHSLNFYYGGLHCAASVNVHVNLTAYIQNVLVKHHDCDYSLVTLQFVSLSLVSDAKMG